LNLNNRVTKTFSGLTVKKVAAVHNDVVEYHIAGYANVYKKRDFHNDVILPRAFEECLINTSKVPMYLEHEVSINGYWTCVEDFYGLRVTGVIFPGSNVELRIIRAIEDGELDGLSVCFNLHDYYYKDKVRYIKKGELLEISLVKSGANDKAFFAPYDRDKSCNF
jgi:HK97 family phage prohead protease